MKPCDDARRAATMKTRGYVPRRYRLYCHHTDRATSIGSVVRRRRAIRKWIDGRRLRRSLRVAPCVPSSGKRLLRSAVVAGGERRPGEAAGRCWRLRARGGPCAMTAAKSCTGKRSDEKQTSHGYLHGWRGSIQKWRRSDWDRRRALRGVVTAAAGWRTASPAAPLARQRTARRAARPEAGRTRQP